MDAELRLDGAPVDVPPTPERSGYGVAASRSGPAMPARTCSPPTSRVGIQVMGYGEYTSYQYPGGLNLAQIAPPPPR